MQGNRGFCHGSVEVLIQENVQHGRKDQEPNTRGQLSSAVRCYGVL
jgi:hypothetical protein